MVTNQICRNLSLSSYTNISHVIDTTVPGRFLKWDQKSYYLKRICSGLGPYLTLIGYSSELSEMAEADELYQSYNLPHNDRLTSDTVLAFGGHYIIWREWCQMLMLFVAVFRYRVNRWRPYKWTLFRIMQHNREQNLIQYHDNNIWKRDVN